MTESADADEDSLLSQAHRWYHIPVLALVGLFMFWSRFQNYDTFRPDDGSVWFQAVDSWYHWRTTNWMIDNVPHFMGFDPWTGFPDGTMAGQFGTLFDSIVVAFSLVIGLGNPSDGDVLLAALVAVPAIAALIVVPLYLIGSHLGTRIGGLAGAAVFALFTGQIFVRSTAGQFQHHAAEVLFMAIAVLAILKAISVAEYERPIWELVRSKELKTLRRATIYSVAAGVAISLYLWVWPPGVVLIGTFGVYLVAQLSFDQYRGRPPDHIAFVGVVSMLVVAVLTAATIQEPGFSATGMDFFPPVFALLVAGGCLFMTALARLWDERSLDDALYPVAVGVSIIASLVALAIVLPDIFQAFTQNLSGRLVPFGHSESALTVQEVDPPDSFFQEFVRDEFGLAFYTGILAIPILAIQSIVGGEERGKYLFVLVWAIILISMGMTQIRFNYYLALGVAVMNAYLVGVLTMGLSVPELVESIETPEDVADQLRGPTAYQIAGVILLAGMLFVPLAPPVAEETPMSVGDGTGPHPDTIAWTESNEWLAEHTPEVGNYGGADNTEAIDYMGRYGWPESGSFAYEEGAYGVLSWWDYGHLITARSERIPHSNPFQQNARSSAAFLTAQNESQAELYLDAIAAGERPSHEADEDRLREAAADSADDPGIQYVMIDDATAGGKFRAITAWTGPDYRAYVTDQELQVGQSQQTGAVGSDAFYDTMTAALYLQDAQGLEHYRLVHESSQYTLLGFVGTSANPGQITQPAGTYDNPIDLGARQETDTIEDVDELLAQIRAEGVGIPMGEGSINDPYVASEVKTFERVEGATISGTVESGDTIEASLDLETGPGRTFTYTQTADVAADGSFEITVPYPSEERLDTEDGYAESSVEALAGYDLDVFEDGEGVWENYDVTVPETAVQFGEDVDPGEFREFREPAEASLSNLDIDGQGDEATIDEGEDVEISVDVENVGEEDGEFELTLGIGEQPTETLTTDVLAPEEETTVTFDGVTQDIPAEAYDVLVDAEDDRLEGQLTITAPGDDDNDEDE